MAAKVAARPVPHSALLVLAAGLLALVGLTLTPPASAQTRGDDRGQTEGAPLSRAEAVERFRKLSPEERMALVDRVAKGEQAFVSVRRGDLVVTVVERGVLEPAEASDVVCRLKARSKDSTIASTIKSVIDEGTLVKKGQRLIELDDSALQEQLRAQKIVSERATADKTWAAEHLALVRKESDVDVRLAEIALKLAEIDLKKYTGDDLDQKQVLELRVEQARLYVERYKALARAKATQAETEAKMKSALADQEAARTREVEAELAKCAIAAPQDGLVLYHVPEQVRGGGGAPIVAQGEPVREGQKLMRICDLSNFVVNTRIHEAVVSRVRTGQTARVQVDAFPNVAHTARVKQVAAIALQQDWLAGDVKVYPTMVVLDEPFRGLKPGMSAEVHIEVATVPKVLQVPLEAVVRVGRDSFCYVRAGKELQERKVVTGLSNESAIEVKGGLAPEDVVLRDPRAVAGLAARQPGRAPRQQEEQVRARSVKPPAGEAARRTRIATYGLTFEDLERIAALPGVTATPVRSFPTEVWRRGRLHGGPLIATVPGYREAAGLRLEAGRFLTDEDDVLRQNVAVLGSETAERLFPAEDALGQTVRLGSDFYRVVGILQEQARPGADPEAVEKDRGVYVPLQTFKARFGERVFVRRGGSSTIEVVPLSEILVAVRGPEHVALTAESIRVLLERSHRQEDWDVQVIGGAPESVR
jgi:biotin carboxyl carrier protein